MSTFKYIQRTALAVAVLVTATGCKDFLEPKSQSEFMATEVEQLNELILTAIPTALTADNSMTCGFFDILTDDVETYQTFVPQINPGETWYNDTHLLHGLYTWQPNWSSREGLGDHKVALMYTDIYKKLVYANSVLDYVDKVKGTDEMKKYVTAQALSLRAFYYLNLVNMFGVPYTSDPDGPGVPIRTTGERENRKMTRNTVAEVYDLIESDLIEAVELFEALPETYHYRLHRPSLPMTLLVLARTYLYMENWEQAELFASKLIREWPSFKMLSSVKLVEDGYTNVAPGAETSTSVEVRTAQKFYDKFKSTENPDVIWPYGSATDAANVTGTEVSTFGLSEQSMPRVVKNGANMTLLLASPSLVDSFDPDDLRLHTYLVRNPFHEPDYSIAGSTFDPAKLKYRAYAKMDMPTVHGSLLPLKDANNFGYALRITEAYLILAEAQAMQPAKQDEALGTLANIWDNCFVGGAAAAPDSYKNGNVIDLVRAERRRELCFESLRWFDLRRWGMKKIEHKWIDVQRGTPQTFVLEAGDPGFTLPTPQYLIQKNTDLGQVPTAFGGRERPASSSQSNR